MDNTELIRIRWHIDRSGETPVFMLVCDDDEHKDLQVSVLGKEKGIAPQYLRFKINGIEE